MVNQHLGYMGYKEVHRLMGSVFLVALLVFASYIFWMLESVESYWMFAAALITGFYFWWGYVFLGEKIYHSQTLFDYFLILS
jgi:hypothetical protein